MAVALRELDRAHGRHRPALRVVEPRPPQPPTPRSVYRRRRLVTLVVVVIVVLATMGAVRAVASPSIAPATVQMTVVVSAGETLWDIAGRYAPTAADRSAWVVDVARRNGIDPAVVQPGTPIVIPVDARRVVADPHVR